MYTYYKIILDYMSEIRYTYRSMGISYVNKSIKIYPKLCGTVRFRNF